MTTITHITAGLVIAKYTNLYLPHSYSPELIYGASVVCSLLPDINVLWHKKLITHHNDFTHYPIFWLCTSLGIFLINRFWGLLILLNTLVHLTLDTFGWRIGVRWLMPFKNKEYSFTKLIADKSDLTVQKIFQHLKNNPTNLVLEVSFNIVFICLLAA